MMNTSDIVSYFYSKNDVHVWVFVKLPRVHTVHVWEFVKPASSTHSTCMGIRKDRLEYTQYMYGYS